MARKRIRIKPRNKGKLRKAAKAKKGRKIPVKKLQQMKRSKSPKTRKRATFALNARKWRKAGSASRR
jgi:oligoendopeptidase F